MNIAVLGSNCEFSSDLAVKLNLLKKSSLVYRYDALSSFKKDIPLYRSLLTNNSCKKEVRDVDIDNEIDLDTPTINTVSNRSPLGQYVGDVETLFLRINDNNKESNELKALRSIFEALNTKVNNVQSYAEVCMRNKINENRRNNEMFTSNLLNIINVYSGVITLPMLNTLLAIDPLTLIIKVKNNNELLPCNITKEELSTIRSKNPQSIIIEVSSCDELFKNNFFIGAFGLNEKEEKRTVEVKEQKEAVVVEMPHIIHMQRVMNPGRGLLVQMAA
jgi:hypothetical protein